MRGFGSVVIFRSRLGDILGNTRNFVGKARYILLVDVGQQGVDGIGSAGFAVAFGGTRNTTAVQGFVEVVHLDDFIFDVRGFGSVVIFRSRLGGTDQDITHTDFTGITLPVVGSEFFHQLSGEIVFFVHKHPVPGNKHVVENHQGFMPAE